MYIFVATLIAIYFMISAAVRYRKRRAPPGYKNVPIVEGEYPIIGHGIEFSKDIVGFVRNAVKKYGPIFRIKIFRVDMVVVADRKLCDEYFKATEKDMSLYDVLDRLYFSDAFSDDPTTLPRIIKLVKKTIAVNFDQFAPKIMEEANKMIERLKKKPADEAIDIQSEMIRFVACTSARCFIAFDLSDEFYDILVKFTNFLNKIVVLTYFAPKWFLRFWFNGRLSEYRHQMTKLLSPEIEKYRVDPEKKDSLVFRTAVDYLDEGRKLTNTEIADVIVCLLYVSSENTALGLSATITDLARNAEFWEMVRNDSKKHLKKNDVRSLFASQVLDACVMESARMNSHIFALNRKPINRMSIGEYWVGGADSVALCEPMLMNYDCADDVYKNPEIYNPNRFLVDNESKDVKKLMTWGAGVHLCPGKMFAIYEIKAAMALITNTFKKINIPDKNIGNKDYFSPSAFAERHVNVHLELKEEDKDDFEDSVGNNFEVSYENQTYNVQRFDTTDGSGWLIKEYFDREQQVGFYKYTIGLSKDSSEHKEIQNIPDHNQYPITYHNLVYTGKSNCDIPSNWYNESHFVWDLLSGNKDVIGFPTGEQKEFNSLYAQLYGRTGYMAAHKDEYVDWGISYNIGASCEFRFGNHTLTLNSGDVFVTDFSKVEHEVVKILQDTEPGWMTNDYAQDNMEETGIETFGRVRLNVQVRNVTRTPENKMTIEEFKEMTCSNLL